MIGRRGPSALKPWRSGRVASSGDRVGRRVGQNVLVMTGLVLLFASCSNPTSGPDLGPSRTDHIAYRVDWDWGRARAYSDEVGAEGWETENDLGYRVRVTQGYLVSHSAQLTACPEEAADHDPDTDAGAADVADVGRMSAAKSFSIAGSEPLPTLRALLDLRPRIAHAGHGEDYGPTAVLTSSVESLLHPELLEFGRLSVNAPVDRRYCEAFYLIAAAGSTAKGLPTDVDMVGSSVYVEGYYSWVDGSGATDEGIETPFTLSTSLANGTIVDLDVLTLVDESTDQIDVDRNFDVHILRDLGAIFDGINFDAMDDADRANALIRALINATSIAVDAT